MSRAFVSEGGSWSYCKKKLEGCMFADENGECMVKSCRVYPDSEPDKKPKAEDVRQK